MSLSIAQLLFLCFALFVIGASGFLVRKNALSMLICLELMLNAVNISLIAFSRLHGNESGSVLYFFVITVAACETAVALAIILNLFRLKRSIRLDEATSLQG